MHRIIYIWALLFVGVSHAMESREQLTFVCAPEQECSKRVACLEIDYALTNATDFAITCNAIRSQADALLLIIDSGGGASGTSEIISREIGNLTHYMPVVTFIKNVCASGAYLVAARSNYIIAPEMAKIGSIGAFTMVVKQDIDEFQRSVESDEGEKESIRGSISYDVISASKKKTVGHPLTEPLTEDERQERIEETRECGEQFAHQVVQARSQLAENQDVWATGDMFSGERAKDIGLIDSNGSYADALGVLSQFLRHQTPDMRITRLELERWEPGEA